MGLAGAGFYASVAWRNLGRHRRRSAIAAVAMAVGVALCMAMTAFSDGMFVEMFRVLVEQRLGHAQVTHPDYPGREHLDDALRDRAALLAVLDADPGVRAASPELAGYVLAGGAQKSTGARVLGVDPARVRAVGRLPDQVVAGRFLDEAPAREAVVGEGLARDLGLELGGELVLVTQAADGSLGNDLYTVVGTVRTGDVRVDRSGVYLHIDDAGELFALPDAAHRITVVTADPDAIEATVERLRRELAGLGPLQVAPWWEVSPETASLFAMRDATAWVMLLIVFSVAAFGVVNTMMMSVFERTRELGVLRAIGLRRGRLVALIVVESLFLAGIAAAIGLVLGGLADGYLVTWGVDYSSAGAEGLSFEGVMLDPIWKGEVRAWPILLTVASVFLVSALASLWPAWRAARLQPVTAIRED